ncbi:unnamed protein product, partial [Rotaria magnacalcarata]
LEELSLVEKCINDQDVELLKLVIIEVCQALKTLDLRNNQIGARGTQLLAEMLKDTRILTVLNLANNHIGDSGAKWLAAVLDQNTTLTTLVLQNNKIGDTGIESLALALEHNKVTLMCYSIHLRFSIMFKLRH